MQTVTQTSINTTVMTLDTALASIKTAIKKNRPTFLWGPPGVGKSDGYRQVAKGLGWGFIDFRASLRDQVDLRGIPVPDIKKKQTLWLPPAELPNVKRDGEYGIFCMDELNTASLGMQTACYGLVLDRVIGEYKLPKGWIPVAAGNRMSDRAAAQRMSTALLNRFMHFEVEPDHKVWCAWAAANGIHPAMIAFIRMRPQLIHVMPQREENSFPTPRSLVTAADFLDEPIQTRVHLISAAIGRPAATELESFLHIYRSLPTMDEIIRNPTVAKIPGAGEPAALWAISAACGRHATRQNCGQMIQYVDRLPKQYQVLFGLDAIARDESLKTTAAFAHWATQVQGILN